MKVEKINTTNAWGFAGWVGTRKTYDNGLIIDYGQWYGRHTGPAQYDRSAIIIDEEEYTLVPRIKGPDGIKNIYLMENCTLAVNASSLEEAINIFKKFVPYTFNENIHEHKI